MPILDETISYPFLMKIIGNCILKLALPVFAVLLMLLPSQAQSAASKATTDDVADIVSHAVEVYFKTAPQAAGLSIGILKDGKSYTHNYGTVEKGKKDVPTAETLYPIASISKTFTGTVLAQAVLEKRVKFDDDVRKYLDGNYPNLEYQGHPIQLGHLVNHNSGLPFNLPDIPENRPPFPGPMSATTQRMLDNYTRKDFLADLHRVDIKTVPGEKFSYSNAGAVLLSIVLEKIYGMPYEEIVKTKIAVPLGMRDTTISVSESQARRLATGYGDIGAVPGPPDMLLGAGALKSTVADMLKYAAWEMAETDPAVKLSHEPRFILSDNFAVGLNWQMLHSGTYRRVWQEGNLPGFVSMCVTLPELKIAIVGLANNGDRASSHALTVLTGDIAKALDARSAPFF